MDMSNKSANTYEIGPMEASDPTHVHVAPKGTALDGAPSPSSGSGSGNGHAGAAHGRPEIVGDVPDVEQGGRTRFSRKLFVQRKKEWFAYMKTRHFWMVLILGQILSLGITGTNTLTSFLVENNNSIPAFQSFFNYVLLFLIYTTYTIYKYGFKGWLRLLLKDGWRYFILSFCDVEGNYFIVLAYRYTTILSAQLIDFWAIAVVVIISLLFLGVRYHITQYIGILVCIGGLGICLASDHITGGSTDAPDQLKGDLFCLLGATFYGLSNTFQEFLVSERPLYEVLGQLGLWGMCINGVQAAIFDRQSFQTATWNGAVGGYFAGYTIVLFVFYNLAPILFRMSSAAFFNISLLTSDFWGVAIGVQVFGYTIHWMYPIAFVLIIVGFFIYFISESILGEAQKPWLGENQEAGIDGIGTAKRKIENPNVIV